MNEYVCEKCGTAFGSETSRNIHQRHCRAGAPAPEPESSGMIGSAGDGAGVSQGSGEPEQCSNCGGYLSPEDYKCGICGTPVDGPGAVANAPMPTGMQILMWFSLASGYAQLVVGGIIGLVSFYLVFSGKAKLGICTLLAGALLFGLGYLLIIMANRLGRGNDGARNFFILANIIGLLAIPVGTIVSGLFLWSLFSEEGKRWCAGLIRRRPVLEGSTIVLLILILVMGGTAMVGLTGVLSAIAIPNFTRAREEARGRACFATQRVYYGGIEMWEMDQIDAGAMPGGLIVDAGGKPGPVGEMLLEDGYVKQMYHCKAGGDIIHDADTSLIECSVHGPVPVD